MPNKEHEIAEKKREKEDKKTSNIVFATMVLSLVACIIYIAVNG